MLSLLKKGMGYFFHPGPDPLAQQTARQATFLAYQTYPDNMVEGLGSLVMQGQRPGTYFGRFQSQQVMVQQVPIMDSLIAGGTVHGGMDLQPLIDTSTTDM